jgi:hypothetical protein
MQISNANHIGHMVNTDFWVSSEVTSAASALHNMMFSKDAMATGYKNFATPISGGAGRIRVGIQWREAFNAWDVGIKVYENNAGIAYTSSTNKWIVDIETKTTTV